MTIKELQAKVLAFVQGRGKIDPLITSSLGPRGVLLLHDALCSGVDLEKAILDAISYVVPVPVPTPSSMKVLVPAYFSPSTVNGKIYWDKLIAAGPNVVAVANNNNGPGTSFDSKYADVINRMINNGGSPIGYVYTSYGARPIEQVLADVAKWFRFYPALKGIFFDEVAATGFSSYYNNLIITMPGRISILNAGTSNIAESLVVDTGATAIVVTEKDGAAFSLPSFAWKYSGKWATLAYGVNNDASMRAYVKDARLKGVSYVYATSDNLSNPWDTLPTYFDYEVSAVSSST